MEHSLQYIKTSSAVKRQVPFFCPAIVQAKLTIGQTNDVYEQEADRMADKIMHQSGGSVNQTNAGAGIQRKCAHCEEEEKLQMKPAGAVAGGIAAPASVHPVLESGGHPIDAGTRNFMEKGFNHDFSHVRIHNDAASHSSSADINAKAYTYNNHIVFGKNHYQPETDSGKHLLAHELTHVVQQSIRTIRRTPNDPDPKQSVYEQYVRDGKYCRDTPETGKFHKGQCYREIPEAEGYPSARQYCFDKITGEFDERSPDYVSAVTGQLEDGSCAPYMGANPLVYLGTLRGRRALGHAMGDICPEDQPLCSQIFGSLTGAIAGFGLPKHGLDSPGLGSIFIPAIMGAIGGWAISKGIPAVDSFVRKRGFLPTYSLGVGSELNLTTGFGFEQRGSGYLSPLKTYLTFGLDSTVDADVLENPGVGSKVVAKLGLRFDPGAQGGFYGLGSVGAGISMKDDIKTITTSELGVGYRFFDFMDVQAVGIQTSGEDNAEFFLKLNFVAPKRVLDKDYFK